MLFNSIDYLFFLPLVFLLYWVLQKKGLKFQNLLILLCSYIFYGWWNWKFLSLIFLSTIIDYFTGLKIYNARDNRIQKAYLCISIFFNLGLLAFFKYSNFFIDSWIDLLHSFGYEPESVWSINLILPIGISFYTFQTMSYSLDIYFKKLKPTDDFISFASFVSFFPQLISGPIERASNLLPQLLSIRKFDYQQAVQGLRLVLWGLFKKVVVADSLAWRVDLVFNNYQSMDGGVLLLGLFYFSFQIYCDFSGYSDIAIGTAKLFGIELKSNFKFPFFSKDIKQFWKRWHISLSSWFRDYLYIPLGGSKTGIWFSIRNIFIIFILSGFWHGPNWTFIMWGFIHALFYIPLFLLNKNQQSVKNVIIKNRVLSSLINLIKIGTTFLSTSIAWVFFRSDSISESFEYLSLMLSKISLPGDNRSGIAFIVILILFDYSFRGNERNPLKYKNSFMRYVIYIILSYFIFAHFELFDTKQFIYFQF